MALIAVVALVVGILAGQFTKSPAQVAAETSPPPHTGIPEVVQLGPVVSSAQLNASVGRMVATTVPIIAPEGTSSAIISALPVAAGDVVEPGSVLAEVSGRPIIALRGAVPVYRTIVPGAEGTDVTQLIAALGEATSTDLSGSSSFDGAAQSALEGLYEARGYSAESMGQEEVDAAAEGLDAAEAAVVDAEDTLDAAETQLSRARRSLPADSDATQQQARTDSISDATKAVTQAERALSQARQDREAATAELGQARAKAGVVVPLGEVVFVPFFPAEVDEVTAKLGSAESTSALTLVSGERVAVAEDTSGSVAGVVPGQRAVIFTPDGEKIEAEVVTAITEEADELGQSTTTIIAKPATPFPETLDGEALRLQVILSASDEDALSVSVAAVSADDRGQTVVMKRFADDTVVAIPVTTGVRGDGRVEISGDISEGDTVLIGGIPTDPEPGQGANSNAPNATPPPGQESGSASPQPSQPGANSPAPGTSPSPAGPAAPPSPSPSSSGR
ncbi:MAG: hypothetical protein ACK5KO_12355 [Arachnia sp.]